MNSRSGWILLDIMKIGGKIYPSPHNTNYILYADEWVLTNGKICDRSFRIFQLGYNQPIRVAGTLTDLAKHPDFVMIDRACYKNHGTESEPNWKYEKNIKQVICKKNILNTRQYEDDKHELCQDRWYLYMRGNGKVISFEVHNDLSKLIPESVS